MGTCCLRKAPKCLEASGHPSLTRRRLPHPNDPDRGAEFPVIAVSLFVEFVVALEQRHASQAKQADARWRKNECRACPKHPLTTWLHEWRPQAESPGAGGNWARLAAAKL